jgi:hypothetical protein
MMHGSTKLKFSDAKQAREIYSYKNIKRKLYRTNAAIWYNNAVLVLNTPDDGRLRPKHVE